MNLAYYGHATFQLTHNDVSIIFDPFLTDNPWNIAQADDIKCNYIFVSHGHFDHYGDTESIAKKNDALVISTFEVCNKASEANCKTHALHLGGKHNFEFGYVLITPALHGSGIPGGHAAGAVIKFYDKVFYFAGDTGLFGDMKLINRFEKIDYALLPIGDNFTMGIEDAALAANWIEPKMIIPMHYKTWPVIDKDPNIFKAIVERKYGILVDVMAPGQTKEI